MKSFLRCPSTQTDAEADGGELAENGQKKGKLDSRCPGRTDMKKIKIKAPWQRGRNVTQGSLEV